MSGRIEVRRNGAAATVVISHPGKLNALTVAMWTGLTDTFLELARDDGLRCVTVRGDGEQAFAAGADIAQFEVERSTREQVTRYHDEIVPRALDAIRNCPVPVIAAIRGACVGGGLEIAAMCDLRISGASGRFGIPIARSGFSLAYGEMERVLDAVGHAALTELLLEARILNAQQARERGLVHRVVDDGALDRHVSDVVEGILSCAPLAVRAHKRQLRRMLDRRTPLSDEERRASYDFADTADYTAGYRAFLAKTRPAFEGR